MVQKMELILSLVDHVLSTKRKRHIIGGTLISVSLLFGGLAITVITLNTEKNKEDNEDNNRKYLEVTTNE